MKDLDAVTLGIVWDRLIAITNEILTALVRTSFSPNVREALDLSVMVFDAHGRQISQGTWSVPSFTGTAVATVKHLLERFPPDTLRPGDVLATNDPWMGTGHVYDINVLRPIFVDGRLIGYTFSITHLPDIGGLGFSASGRSIYEEGLRLPICKLVSEGVLNDELFELIALNVRVPDQTIGDLHANLSCTEVGGRLLIEFMREYDITDLTEIADLIIGYSERAMREQIAEIPDGVYENSFQIDGHENPLTLACKVDVKGDQIHVDFSGTSPVVDIGINVPITYSSAFVMYGLKCLTIPHIPNNLGCVLPIRVTGPENCILNAQPPYPTGGRHTVGHFVCPLVFGALAKALPGKVQADSGMITLVNVQGAHWDGREVSSIYYSSGGYGALPDRDGLSTVPSPSNMIACPVEVWEDLTGTIVERKELLTDSGGAGKFRGGLGQQWVMRNDSDQILTLSCFATRTEFPALGMLGGGNGSARTLQINNETVHPKGRYVLQPGDVLTLSDAGGGGFGDPAERDPDLILQDIRQGNVSKEAARRDYNFTM